MNDNLAEFRNRDKKPEPPLPPAEPSCGGCRHYRGSSLGRGICTRYPPTTFPMFTPEGQMSGVTMWANVEPNMVCGEYATRVA